MNQEDTKKLIESAELKKINYKEHTKYLSEENIVLLTDYPKGINIYPHEIGYSFDEHARIISEGGM